MVLYIAELVFSPSTVLDSLKDGVIGAAVIGLFFLLISLVFKNSMGMGDIKLFALMGLYQGLWGAFNSVFFSLLVSFFLALGLLISKKKKRRYKGCKTNVSPFSVQFRKDVCYFLA